MTDIPLLIGYQNRNDPKAPSVSCTLYLKLDRLHWLFLIDLLSLPTSWFSIMIRTLK